MEKPVDKETAKEQFRSSRLSWSNQAEHVRELLMITLMP